MKAVHLYAKLIPLESLGGIDPPAEKLEPVWINVQGREEHEAMLRDEDKMRNLGLDPTYEKVVYLHRWGSWLNGSVNHDGKYENDKN